MPKYFEIRWVEYTYSIFRGVLTNWNALILYFAENYDSQTSGFKFFLTSVDKLKSLTFFADLLFVYQRFQKQLQSDTLTLPIFSEHVRNITITLNDLKSNPIAGGFEYMLNKQMENKDVKFYLKNIELTQHGFSRRQPLPIHEMRNKTIDALTQYLKVRMEGENEDLLKQSTSF